jgi:hypothetical protein
MSATSHISSHTLGAELERDRLECRVRRMTVAIGVLRKRECESRLGPDVRPRHLGHVIADFHAQIDAMNTRLRNLGVDGPSNPDTARSRLTRRLTVSDPVSIREE